MPEVVLVKLGGSLITDKRAQERFRPRVVRRLAEEVVAAIRASPRLAIVLGHGAGSFGHAAAVRHGLGSGPVAPGRMRGVSITQDRTARLHRKVMDALLEAGARPFSVAPSSFMVARAGRPSEVHVGPICRALELGLLPILFGDVVLDRTWGATICSTETAFLAIASRLRRRGWEVPRVLWMGDTDGVLDANGHTMPHAGPAGHARVLRVAGGARGADVTGGMAHRVQIAVRLTRLGVTSWILDGTVPGRLRQALLGKEVSGTRVSPRD